MSENIAKLFEAVQNGNLDEVKELLTKDDIDINEIYDGKTVLHNAVENQNPEIVKFLLSQKDLRTDIKTSSGSSTALHTACWDYYASSYEIVNMLLERDHTLVNIENSAKLLPIHYACRNNKLRLVKIFVKHGTNVNHRDAVGRTCLIYALKAGNYSKIIQYFLTSTAIDPTIKDRNGKTVLHCILDEERRDGRKTKSLIYKLIDKIIQINPETQKYDFKEVFRYTKLTCYHRYFNEYFIEKFYKENNSKYYLIDQLERYSFGDIKDQKDRFFLYIFVHDEMPREDIEESVVFDIHRTPPLSIPSGEYFFDSSRFYTAHFPFIEKALQSDEFLRSTLELFHYLNGLGCYVQTSLDEILTVCIGNFDIVKNLSSKDHFERFYKLMNFFNKIGLNFDIILVNFLINSLEKLLDNAILNKTIFSLLPFTRNFFRDFLKLSPNDKFLELMQNLQMKNFIKNLFQNYGDTSSYITNKELNLNVFSLQHICRDNIRKILLENTKSRSEFSSKLEELIPSKTFLSYLRFEEFYGEIDGNRSFKRNLVDLKVGEAKKLKTDGDSSSLT